MRSNYSRRHNMWIAIGIIGAGWLINFAVTLLVLARLHEAEMFLIVMSGVIMGRETNEEIIAYLKSRSDHPAGKKGVRQPRRMDGEGTT
jgi:hypothetical protein